MGTNELINQSVYCRNSELLKLAEILLRIVVILWFKFDVLICCILLVYLLVYFCTDLENFVLEVHLKIQYDSNMIVILIMEIII